MVRLRTDGGIAHVPSLMPRAVRRGLRVVAVLLTVGYVLGARQAHADYVGSLTNRIYVDPADIAVIADGYQNGDEISYILETTPADTGSTQGENAYMTVYVPPGVEVIGAEFVEPSGSLFVAVPAHDVDPINQDCGNRGCKSFTPVLPTNPALGKGSIAEVQQDTGIFYSTDSRTALIVPAGNRPTVDPTGVAVQSVANLWDRDQVLAFGTNSPAALSGNAGTGQTPLVTTDSGTTWKGTGSAVAGPLTCFTNDYNPSCNAAGSTAFIQDVQCVGPWQRIQYPNSKFGCAGAIVPKTTSAVGGLTNTSVLTAAGVAVSPGAPLPATTNTVRWVHGGRRLGDIENGRITFRITDATAFVNSFRPGVTATDISFLNTNPDKIHRVSGSWITDGFVVGDVVTVSGAANAANNTSLYDRGGVGHGPDSH